MFGYSHKFEFGGPKIPFKFVPCKGLNSQQLQQLFSSCCATLSNCGARVVAVITDNCLSNQKFLDNCITEDITPLCNTVHLMKSIRNCFFTKGNFNYTNPDTGEIQIAHWSVLVDLYNSESESLVKSSTLTK